MFCSNDYAGTEALSLNVVKGIVDEFRALGGQVFEISGGEPLAHPDLAGIVEYARNAGLSVQLYSNCSPDGKTPISDEMAAVLARNGVTVHISLEGKRETHDLLCGGGTFDLLQKSAKVLERNGVKVCSHFVPNKINQNDAIPVIQIARKMGVEKMGILRFVPQGNGLRNRKALELTPRDFFNVTQNMVSFSDDYVVLGHPMGAVFNCYGTTCQAGRCTCLVKADGDVTPCPAFKQAASMCCGNISKESLTSIWNNSPVLAELRTDNNDMPELCSTCMKKSLCGGGCRAQRAMHHTKIDPLCAYMRSPVRVKAEGYEPMDISTFETDECGFLIIRCPCGNNDDFYLADNSEPHSETYLCRSCMSSIKVYYDDNEQIVWAGRREG